MPSVHLWLLTGLVYYFDHHGRVERDTVSSHAARWKKPELVCIGKEGGRARETEWNWFSGSQSVDDEEEGRGE